MTIPKHLASALCTVGGFLEGGLPPTDDDIIALAACIVLTAYPALAGTQKE